MVDQLSSIRIVHGALDEVKESSSGIILRGIVLPESLHKLLRDDYQREAQPLSSQWRILDALNKGEPLPDIELGMRGQGFKTEKDGSFTLLDPVYIIDGLQRVTTAIHFLGQGGDKAVRMGATVHFDTNKEWERRRFHILNTNRLKVSPNVILRNKREESSTIAMIYNLTVNDRPFVLHGRVSWTQRMNKGELVTALTFAKVIGILHSHKAPTQRVAIEELVPALDKALQVFGIQAMRENIRTFFSLIDECWGIKRVQYKEGAIYMRGSFLYVLAKLISDHHDFWKRDPQERKLFVDADLKRKISQFPTNDPQIMNLAGSGGKSREILYILLRDHINRGKTTKRLSPRSSDGMGELEDLETPDEDEDSKAA